jgi:chromosomal replication initiator protein
MTLNNPHIMLTSYMAFPGLPHQNVDPNRDPERIMMTVARYFNLTFTVMVSHSRQGDLPLARFICYLLLQKYTTLTLKAMGELTNGRDHTTVMAGLERLNGRIETDDRIKSIVNEIETLL